MGKTIEPPPTTITATVVLLSIMVLGLTLMPLAFATKSAPLNRTWYVDDDSTDGPWDGSLAHPYLHINDATRNVRANDTVFVC